MGLPFVVVEGAVLIVDKDGKIADIVKVGDDISRLATESVIVGADGETRADVEGDNTGDNRLLVSSKESLEALANTKKMMCLLDELVRQLRILNTHMECVTDLEDLEEEPGDHPLV